MFDKPSQLVGLQPESIPETQLYFSRQAFSQYGEQSPSLGFALYWLQMLRETYTKAHKIHPKSKVKREQYRAAHYPFGVSIYRNPSRFYRWYLSRNGGLNIGDPTGLYYVPLNSIDVKLERVPHPEPNMLADNFTLELLKYYLNPPKLRMTRPATNYGFVKLHVKPYVSLQKFKGQIRWIKKGGTQISGYLDNDIIREVIRNEINLYIHQFRECMDDRYVRFLGSQISGLRI